MKSTYVIKNKTRFVLFLVITLTIMFTAIISTNVYGYKETSYKIITVKSGDTLWDIASRYGDKNVDIRKTIFEIQKMNNMSSSCLYEGDEIKIAIKQ